ncbi:MAG: spermidine/putrescine ABC transporter substrate-binding protein [Gammaproteobacteria bacterium]|nr:spermidine/putrescine ABC transporter substrate-binding protein [Gammaproteobacteria bacterium]
MITQLGRMLSFPFLVLPFLFPLIVSAQASAENSKNELVILNWSEYIDPDLINKFEHQYNAKISEIFYESGAARDDMMVSTDASGIDIVVVNGIVISDYKEAGWLEPISAQKIPNLRHIMPRMRNAFADAETHAVPYFYGDVGIAYRKDLVKEAPESWMDMFQPEPYLHGKISMTSDVRDVFGAALKALGYSLNSDDPEEHEAAANLLKKQKPYVKTYNYLTLDRESALVKGDDIAMALFYSGDAIMVGQYNDNIDYVAPKEGSYIWIDYMTVMKKSDNKQLAFDFINFLNEPDNAAQLAEYVYYATPNKAAKKLLSAEILNNKIIYPPAEILGKSEFYRELPIDVLKIRNTAMSELLQ